MTAFKRYAKEDYESVCSFLIELCRRDRTHINWNWARFEWMAEHPEFDQSLISSIGLWIDGDKIVGAVIYDMYFGEAFCGVLPEYDTLYPEILEYAWRELKNDNGLGIAICDNDPRQIQAALACGFARADQSETVMAPGWAVSLELISTKEAVPFYLSKGFEERPCDWDGPWMFKMIRKEG